MNKFTHALSAISILFCHGLLGGQLGYLSYEIVDNEVSIIGCSVTASGEIVIPSLIEEKPVTSIGNEVFYRRSNVTRVVIPEGVVSIGNLAFADNTGIISVEMPISLTNIGFSAFRGCSSLAEISIPYGVLSIGSSTFYGCSQLEEISIPETVTTIGNNAFNSCSSLEKVILQSGLISIGTSAFGNCGNITEIEFPDSLTDIGRDAFWHCSNLTRVRMSENIENIGSYAFRRCTSLREFHIPSSARNLGDNVFSFCTNLSYVFFEGDMPETLSSTFLLDAPSSTLAYIYEDAQGFPRFSLQGKRIQNLRLAGDNDGDSFTNQIERSLGTNPLDSNSKFDVWLEQRDRKLDIHYTPHSASCLFTVESTTDLSDPESWQEVYGLAFSGNLNEKYAELTSPDEDFRFYRISIANIE